MTRHKTVATSVYGLVVVLVVGLAVAFSFRSATAGTEARANLTLIAPAGAGGGWDSFTREFQQAARTSGLVNNAQVVNIPGAGGTIGLGRVSAMRDEPATLLATGAAMTGGIELNESPVGFDDVTPIAAMAEDFDVITVPADSPHQTLEDLVTAWQEDPAGFPVTGGSAGSIDHLVLADLAISAGIDAGDITFIPESGGGEAVQTMVSGAAQAAATGYNEISDQIEAGRVRALGISAPEPVQGIDVPTIKEQGYDTELANWRGFLAPPGLSDEEQGELRQLVRDVVASSEWEDAMERNQWEPAYLEGDEFVTFLEEDTRRTRELLEELGL
ncbi:Bug family tripartite tricarboxylate transporter substrate binding protein [Georgenia deserti]|uniref:Bug family tripartite tricarboxylate transporter substrate binding protein n=1 Tax=Georgenia deserti TaxID=2093781 RepID=A0ABW4L3R3_9MICO